MATQTLGFTELFTPAPQAETEHFTCSVLGHSFHRQDGHKLTFVFGHLATNDSNDSKYIKTEIANGNPYVRVATVDEIKMHAMRMDPVAAIKRDIAPAMEVEITDRLTAQLREQVMKAMASTGVNLTADQLTTMFGPESPVTTDQSQLALEGVSGADNAAQRLSEALRSGSGTVLGGISGTDKNNVNAALYDK
jgi:hypothetical protein